MKVKVILTKDGSKSLYLSEMNETYHSKFGAKTESIHVFINAGFKQIKNNEIAILEVGFGTGLNVLLTYFEAEKSQKRIYFESLEKYPLPESILHEINNFKEANYRVLFNKIHQASWQQPVNLSEHFTLFKNQVDLLAYQSTHKFDLIYFDAFDPNKQPEMWTQEIFNKMYALLNENGILVTYSAKGSVRRTMQAAGFLIERIPGPPGKREMLRAKK